MKKSLFCYIYLLPLTLSFGAPSPWTVVAQVIFSPFFSYLLFPLSLLSYFFTPLTSITDLFWLNSEWLIQRLSQDMPAGVQIQALPYTTLWSYFLFLLLIHIWKEKDLLEAHSRRNKLNFVNKDQAQHEKIDLEGH